MARTRGLFGNKCPYCGDKVYKTYGNFGQIVAKCKRCDKRAQQMREQGLTDEQIINILED